MIPQYSNAFPLLDYFKMYLIFKDIFYIQHTFFYRTKKEKHCRLRKELEILNIHSFNVRLQSNL